MRKKKVLLRVNGNPTFVTAQVYKIVPEPNDRFDEPILCGYIRRNGRQIRVHFHPVVGVWVATWDYPLN